MNLLPLQIVLGFQVAAAVVIFIQLMKGEDGDGPLRAEKADGLRKRRAILRSPGDDAR